ncbi:base excision DNA repair protein [Colletotrichum abscissum]|uniref:Base excision DNA repair protein n=1 Tax=Colletotrichum abscissum TaxID=1671311 RepID=A0A9P9XJP5_9PEZI|nr:base excision DNA repair protein [Colletotrichum abscissum]KAI3554979.1 base excision DNA repair protein [Colletotrichum abscissum]KAK1493444.1 base excision DNA repair protein [Colletotrichum abscissum]
MERLVEALRPDGMQSKEAKILMQLLDKWDLQHPFNASDEEVVKDLVGYWGLGSNGVFCLMRICVNQDVFAVDTHTYHITGLWG